MPQKVTFELVAAAANHCWSNKFLDIFRDFFAENAYLFKDAPLEMGEQDMDQYALYQKYLHIYENHLSTYIESLDVSVEEFYYLLADIKDDPKVVDKKLLHFVNYLLACTDYGTFYKVMVRAAKKAAKADSKADSKAVSKGTSSGDKTSSNNDSDAKSEEKNSAEHVDAKDNK